MVCISTKGQEFFFAVCEDNESQTLHILQSAAHTRSLYSSAADALCRPWLETLIVPHQNGNSQGIKKLPTTM